MRLPDWATRLDAYIVANAAATFSYDSALGLDCCSFTFGAIRAMTGVAIGEQFRYRTKREALREMRKYVRRPALTPFIAKLMRANGFDSCPAMYAGRGDVLVCPNGPAGEFFGVLALNGKDILSVGENGLRRVPISIRCKAWKI